MEKHHKQNGRRDFLKKFGLLGAAIPLVGSQQLMAASSAADETTMLPAERKVILNILQTTDVHCQIHPHDELFWENGKAVFRQTGGYAQLASYLKAERAAHANTFLVDTGDMFQGSELSVKTSGKALQPILNALDYNLYLPGNWEVVYYKKAMQQLLGGLNAPKVCANMYHDLGDGKRGELIFHPYHVWHVAGIKVGFLGYTDPLVPLRQSPNYSKGIVYTKPEDNLAHYVDVLRNDEGCSYVILLSHLGLSQQIALANMLECKGVDIILGGDTHERVREPIVCTHSKVVEPGAFGSFVGKLQLVVENGKIVEENYVLDELSASKYPADSNMDQLISKIEQPYLDDINTVIGYSSLPLYRYFVVENTIDTLILDALKWRLPEVDVVLSNGFRFCPPRSTPDHTGNIPITNGFLFDMLPVDSTLRTAKVTGKQLRDWLEKELNNVFAKDASKRFGGWLIKFKGMTMTFNAFGDMGQRVQEVKVGRKPLDLEKVYSVAACERDGDPADMLCRIKGVKDAVNQPHTLHSTLKAYLKEHSPVKPAPRGSARVLDAPQELLTQVSGVPYTFR
jgi:2',3'-cyclic-nucleotide 2'-phosphodiesterase (5'-nucleotidase family)